MVAFFLIPADEYNGYIDSRFLHAFVVFYRLLVLLYFLFANFADPKPVVGLSAMLRVTK